MCKACNHGFVRKQRFLAHVRKCVGGHMPSMNFDRIPRLEKFESKEYRDTLLAPVFASFHTEASQTLDISRWKKNSKTDSGKEAEMI